MIKVIKIVFLLVAFTSCKEQPVLVENVNNTEQKYQIDKARFEALVAPLNLERTKLENEVIALREQGTWNDSLQTAYWGIEGHISKIDNQYDAKSMEFIAQNLNTAYGLDKLMKSKSFLPRKFIKKQVGKLSPEMSTSENARILQMFLAYKPLKTGDRFYDLKAISRKGDAQSLNEILTNTNKYTLLEFSSAYCSWCIKSIPFIKSLEDTYASQLNIVTINLDDTPELGIEQHENSDIERPYLWTAGGRNSEAYLKYLIEGTPTYFLLDKDGMLIRKWVGFEASTIASITKEIDSHSRQLTVVNGN